MSSATIEPPDTHHLSAAVGWLELGNAAEATQDLDRMDPALRVHPDVLKVRWQILSKTNEWAKCIEVATKCTKVAPKEPFGWIHLSFSLHELRRTQEAYDSLIGVLKKFPEEWLMRYNLACYSCQLGNLEEAKQWLAKAKKDGGARQIRQMAQNDPDLTPLFEGPQKA